MMRRRPSSSSHDDNHDDADVEENDVEDDPSFNGDDSRRRYRGLFVGQLISLSLTFANASSSYLSNEHRVHIPTLSTGVVYALLSLRYLAMRTRAASHRHRRNDDDCDNCDDVEDCDDCVVGDCAIRVDGNGDNQPAKDSDMADATSPTRRRRPRRPRSRRRYFPFAQDELTRHAPWHVYAVLSVLDVEANYLAMVSFRHTSLSSSMLLTSLSVLSTIVLRRMMPPPMMRRIGNDDDIGHDERSRRLVVVVGGGGGSRTRRTIGVTLCLFGGCSWLVREFRRGGDGDGDGGNDDVVDYDGSDDWGGHAAPVLYGDALALAAACVYGLNDVLAEYFLKASGDDDDDGDGDGDGDGDEYLGMIGLFGAAFSFCVQAPLLGEWDRARTLLVGTTPRDVVASGIVSEEHNFGGVVDIVPRPTTAAAISLSFLSFVIALFYFYTLAMAYMRRYDSTSLNLSLQSGPLWAVVLTMIRKSLSADGRDGVVGIPPAMFFASFAMILAGMFLYENDTGETVLVGDGNMSSSSKSAKLDRSTNYGSTELIQGK